MLLPIDQNSPSDAETTSSRPNRASPGTSNMVGRFLGDTLRKDIVMSRGMVTLNDSDSEELINDKLASSLKSKYAMLEKSDF